MASRRSPDGAMLSEALQYPTLIAHFELPAFGIVAQAAFALKPSNQERVLETARELVEAAASDLQECLINDSVTSDLEAARKKLEMLRKRTLADMEGWQRDVKLVNDWRKKVARAEKQMTDMREAYYKELFHLREQVYQQGKARTEDRDFLPMFETYFDPSEFAFDEGLARIVKEKFSLLQQEFEAKLRESCAGESGRLKDQLVSARLRNKMTDMLLKHIMLKHGYQDESHMRQQFSAADLHVSEDSIKEAIERTVGQSRKHGEMFKKVDDGTPSADRLFLSVETCEVSTDVSSFADPLPSVERHDRAVQSTIDSVVLDKAIEVCDAAAESDWRGRPGAAALFPVRALAALDSTDSLPQSQSWKSVVCQTEPVIVLDLDLSFAAACGESDMANAIAPVGQGHTSFALLGQANTGKNHATNAGSCVGTVAQRRCNPTTAALAGAVPLTVEDLCSKHGVKSGSDFTGRTSVETTGKCHGMNSGSKSPTPRCSSQGLQQPGVRRSLVQQLRHATLPARSSSPLTHGRDDDDDDGDDCDLPRRNMTTARLVARAPRPTSHAERRSSMLPWAETCPESSFVEAPSREGLEQRGSGLSSWHAESSDPIPTERLSSSRRIQSDLSSPRHQNVHDQFLNDEQPRSSVLQELPHSEQQISQENEGAAACTARYGALLGADRLPALKSQRPRRLSMPSRTPMKVAELGSVPDQMPGGWRRPEQMVPSCRPPTPWEQPLLGLQESTAPSRGGRADGLPARKSFSCVRPSVLFSRDVEPGRVTQPQMGVFSVEAAPLTPLVTPLTPTKPPGGRVGQRPVRLAGKPKAKQ